MYAIPKNNTAANQHGAGRPTESCGSEDLWSSFAQIDVICDPGEGTTNAIMYDKVSSKAAAHHHALTDLSPHNVLIPSDASLLSSGLQNHANIAEQ